MVTASQVLLVVKNSPDNAGDLRLRLDPWVTKTPWRRAWRPTPVFMPEVSHEQRSLVGYSPQSLKELDMTSDLAHLHMVIMFKKLRVLQKRKSM